MSQPDIERRHFVCDALAIETRAGKDGKEHRVIRGHAAVFNQRSEDLGGWREQIAPGAFREAIETDDVRALWNHNPDYVLGRNRSNTLTLSEDARGLAIEVAPPDTQWARDLLISIDRGDVNQMSFAFSVRPNGQDWAKDDDGTVVRTLKRVRLYDVSPVTYPAYPQTDVAARSLRTWQDAGSAQDEAHRTAATLHGLDLMRRRLALLG